jgi:hypothetical protein
MKRYLKLVPVLLLLAFGAVVSSPAMAQRVGHGFGHGHGSVYVRGHGGGVGLGIALGAALIGLAYYATPAYSYPVYSTPAYVDPGPVVAASAGYVQQVVPQAAPAPAQSQGDWYYCADSKSYYPYARECPGGWQRVPSTPPR